MLKLFSLREAFPVCDAIGSPVRTEILEILSTLKSVNLNTLAKRLHLTNGALTKHIKKLEDAGLIHTKQTKGKRGYQKECGLKTDNILISLFDGENAENGNNGNIPIGLYSDVKAKGLCGLAESTGFIGSRDDASVFNSQKRASAAALWIQNGFVTYPLPVSRDLKNQKINEITLSFEISPDITGGGFNPGGITFGIGEDISKTVNLFPPLERRRGFLTPAWWEDSLPQYGSLKLIRITKNASYLDGEKISDATVKNILADPRFTLSTTSGIFLFGKNFGDYNQDLHFNFISEDA